MVFHDGDFRRMTSVEGKSGDLGPSSVRYDELPSLSVPKGKRDKRQNQSSRLEEWPRKSWSKVLYISAPLSLLLSLSSSYLYLYIQGSIVIYPSLSQSLSLWHLLLLRFHSSRTCWLLLPHQCAWWSSLNKTQRSLFQRYFHPQSLPPYCISRSFLLNLLHYLLLVPVDDRFYICVGSEVTEGSK